MAGVRGFPAARIHAASCMNPPGRSFRARVFDLHGAHVLAVVGFEHLHHVVVGIDDAHGLADRDRRAVVHRVGHLGDEGVGLRRRIVVAFAGHEAGGHVVDPAGDVLTAHVVVAHAADAVERLTHAPAYYMLPDLGTAEPPCVLGSAYCRERGGPTGLTP